MILLHVVYADHWGKRDNKISSNARVIIVDVCVAVAGTIFVCTAGQDIDNLEEFRSRKLHVCAAGTFMKISYKIDTTAENNIIIMMWSCNYSRVCTYVRVCAQMIRYTKWSRTGIRRYVYIVYNNYTTTGATCSCRPR